jgi:hypothetical protein
MLRIETGLLSGFDFRKIITEVVKVSELKILNFN